MTPSIMRMLNNKQFKDALEHAEKEIYLSAYKYSERNQSEAARLLGVSRNTFRNKLIEWKLLLSKV